MQDLRREVSANARKNFCSPGKFISRGAYERQCCAKKQLLARGKTTEIIEVNQSRSFTTLIFIVILGVGAAMAYAVHMVGADSGAVGTGIGALILALVASSAIRVANQWDRAVILRLGKFHSLKGPGLFFMIPVIDVIPYWIDTRVITTGFKAEKTLTKDTVPVDVDAVLFWKVLDPKKAALDVADYQSAISWASQTALRDVIGKTMLGHVGGSGQN
jgi:SPFH domain / Band 7 family